MSSLVSENKYTFSCGNHYQNESSLSSRSTRKKKLTAVTIAMSLFCSDRVYFVSLLVFHSVVCCLAAATAVIMGLDQGLSDFKCYFFQSKIMKDKANAMPCLFLMYAYIIIAGWSLLSILCHGLCSFWRTLEVCLRVGFGMASVITLLSWVSSVSMSIGFITWCESISRNVTTHFSISDCLYAAEHFDTRNNSTDMSAFFYLGSTSQGSGWLVSVLCVCLAIMYLQCCCCKRDIKPVSTEEDEHNDCQVLVNENT